MALTKVDDRGLKTPIDLQDNEKIRLGTGNDFEIYFNGTNTSLYTNTGDITIQTAGDDIELLANDDIKLLVAGGVETSVNCIGHGAVELYHDNSKKLETTSGGILIANGNISSVPAGNGTASGVSLDTTGGDIFTGRVFIQGDNKSADSDFLTGINNNGSQIVLYDYSNSEYLQKWNKNGGVELYHNNDKKLDTSSSGINVTGSIFLADNSYLYLGTGNDFLLGHAGTDSFLRNDTGELYIRSDGIRIVNQGNDENYIKCIDDGAVELYYNNTLALATIDKGIKLHNGGFSQLKFYDVNTSTIAMYTNSVNLRWYDDVNGDNIMQLSQNGDLNIDGSYSNSGVDYAEYFESTDGSAIAIGTTVVLENGKVRAATGSETPIGVIRPKTSGTSVTGGVNQLNWQGKYLVDDYDGQVMESAVHCTWVDDDKKDQQCWKDKPPTGVTIPSDAVETTRERPKLNPLFDESKTYVPRSERDEWNCVGLLGQIPITKGQPTSSSWIKMKDRSTTVELWMVK